MALVLVCSVVFYRTKLTKFMNNGIWYSQLLVVFWQMLSEM